MRQGQAELYEQVGAVGSVRDKLDSYLVSHYVLLLLLWLQIKFLIRGRREGGGLRVQERFIAGSLAGATAQTIIYPMEVRVELHGCIRKG